MRKKSQTFSSNFNTIQTQNVTQPYDCLLPSSLVLNLLFQINLEFLLFLLSIFVFLYGKQE